MKPKLLKVNCSFCGIEIECPEEMKDIKKHACFRCFQNLGEHPPEKLEKIHVDIPSDEMDEVMLNALMACIMKEFFPKFWKGEKTRLKKMRKKEIVEESFAAGAVTAFHAMKEIGKNLDDDDFIEELANMEEIDDKTE